MVTVYIQSDIQGTIVDNFSFLTLMTNIYTFYQKKNDKYHKWNLNFTNFEWNRISLRFALYFFHFEDILWMYSFSAFGICVLWNIEVLTKLFNTNAGRF